MWACRILDNGHVILHIHDTPAFFNDLVRNEKLGWQIDRLNWCQREDLPFGSGDPGVRPSTIMDLVRR